MPSEQAKRAASDYAEMRNRYESLFALCEEINHALWPDDPHRDTAEAPRRIDELRAENARLRECLRDAIRRPLGVVPDSAAEFMQERSDAE